MRSHLKFLGSILFAVTFLVGGFFVANTAQAYTQDDFAAFGGVDSTLHANGYTSGSGITATYTGGTGTVSAPVNLTLTGYAPIVTPWFGTGWTTYNYVTIGIKLPIGFSGTPSVYRTGIMRYDTTPNAYKMSTIGDGTTPLATDGAALGYLDYSFAANSINTKKDGLVKLQVIWNVGDAPEYFIIDINGLQLAPSDVTLLDAAKATAAGLVAANATEGTVPGNHVVGSLATLSAANTAANATVASPQLTVDGQVTTLNAAISAYNAAIVPVIHTLADFAVFDGVGSPLHANGYTFSSGITATYPESNTIKLTGYAPIVIPWFMPSWTTYNYVTIGIKLPTGFTGTRVYQTGVMQYTDANPNGIYVMGAGSTDLATTGDASTYLDFSFGANKSYVKSGLVFLKVIWNTGDTPEYFIIDINGLQLAPSDVTLLDAAKATAAGLVAANATEGTVPGNHVVGSLATLSAANTAANATVASPQLTVDGQVTTLNAAISAYNLAIVPPPVNNGGGSRRATPAVPAKVETPDGCAAGNKFSTTTGRNCNAATPAVPAGQVLGASTQAGQVLGTEKFNFTIFVKNGSNGNEIMELQKFLNTLGYTTLIVDGKFGPKTKGAVIKFQIANGLKGDGIVGPLTRAVLNK